MMMMVVMMVVVVVVVVVMMMRENKWEGSHSNRLRTPSTTTRRRGEACDTAHTMLTCSTATITLKPPQ